MAKPKYMCCDSKHPDSQPIFFELEGKNRKCPACGSTCVSKVSADSLDEVVQSLDAPSKEKIA